MYQDVDIFKFKAVNTAFICNSFFCLFYINVGLRFEISVVNKMNTEGIIGESRSSKIIYKNNVGK